MSKKPRRKETLSGKLLEFIRLRNESTMRSEEKTLRKRVLRRWELGFIDVIINQRSFPTLSLRCSLPYTEILHTTFSVQLFQSFKCKGKEIGNIEPANGWKGYFLPYLLCTTGAFTIPSILYGLEFQKSSKTIYPSDYPAVHLNGCFKWQM